MNLHKENEFENGICAHLMTVVRLCWRGMRPINLPATVRYYRAEEGGVSHFR